MDRQEQLLRRSSHSTAYQPLARRGFLPNAYVDYMETSRRDPVTRDPWGDDQHTSERRDHRDREPYRNRSRSLERRTEKYSEYARGWKREGDRRSREYHQDAQGGYNSTRRHRSRSTHRSPQPGHEGTRGSRRDSRYNSKIREISRDRRRDSLSTTSREILPPGSPDRAPVSAKLHSRRSFDRDEAIDTPGRRHPPREGHRDLIEDSRRSRSRHRDEERGRELYRRHQFSRQFSPPPRRDEYPDADCRPRSPGNRWTEAEVEEYYRRRDEEEAWRFHRESPHGRERAYDEYYQPRDLSRPYPSHSEQETSYHEWSRSRPREYDSEYSGYRDADHRRHPPSRYDDRMEGTRPIQSVMDDRERVREQPRGQRIPSFESSHRGRGRGRGGFDSSRGRGGYHGNGPPPPPIDTRNQFPSNSHYGTPAGSYHGSPHSASPYSQHGGWHTSQHYYHAPPTHAYAAAPHSRPGSYPPQQPPTYYAPQPNQYPPSQPQTPTYPTSAYRGGHASQRGGSYPPPQDRRFPSASMAPSPPQNATQPATRGGRGHFQNLRWTASGGTQGGKPPDGSVGSAQDSREQSVQSTAPPPPPPAANDPAPPPPEEDNPFRPSKAFRVEDDSTKPEETANVEAKEPAPTPKEPRFSFAFKGKAPPTPAAKPVTDLTQKMKEPPVAPRRDPPQDAPKKPAASFSRDVPVHPPPNLASERKADPTPSRDPRDRFAGQRQQREAEAERYKAERQAQLQRNRPGDRQTRDTDRHEVERAKPKPQVVKVKQKRKRAKPRPQLAPELKASKSVYYRKQGNESVVGSGTYGKVYKALHVYTGALVALKKIRMEGEKDGFPVTAVREIKLLQSLRHSNVVRLQEVMVENNDCYMVFEYLSHDLTGLLNHPTFKLEHAHKKDLAKQLFQSLDYLHRRGVLHRDLKAANILVSSSGQLKLADFGLARFYSKHHTLDYTNRVITIWYRPPELLLGETQYGPAVDIWSAACVLVEIFTKHAIFPGDGGEINQLEKIYNILGTPTRSDWPGLADMAWFELLRPAERRRNIFREKYGDRVSEQAFELLAAMFQYDPTKRPTAEEVLEHPYFTAEDPAPRQVTELANVDGDWHEFESKALRKENERRARKAAEAEREKAKRRAPGEGPRDAKRLKNDNTAEDADVALSNTKEKSTDADAMTGIEPNMEPT